MSLSNSSRRHPPLMVNSTPQTRLLASLLKSTKEYNTTLTSHLVVSHTSLSGLQAYASASSPTTAASILGVADALKGADDAFARYASEVDHWRERLKEVKNAEEDVANILRDRDILVTRLIKASSKKPTRDSIIHAGSPASSVISLGLTTGGSAQTGMATAQAELAGCEAQLAQKQRQLDQIRSIAIRDGLEQRCHALVRLGAMLSDRGNEGVRALQDGYSASAGAMGSSYGENGMPVGSDAYYRNLPPRPTSPSENGSLAPSQSASQLGNYANGPSSPGGPNSSAPGRPNRHPYRAVLMPSSPEGPRKDEEDGSDSDDDGDANGPVQVVENTPRRATSPPPFNRVPLPAPTRRPSNPRNFSSNRQHSSDIGPMTQGRTYPGAAGGAGPSKLRRTISHGSSVDEGRKKRGFFGAVAGFFRGNNNNNNANSKNRSVSSPTTDTFRRGGGAGGGGGGGWSTRTDKNIAEARNGGGGDGSSSDEDAGHAGNNFVAVENKGKGRSKSVSAPAPKAVSRASPAPSGAGPKRLARSNSTSTATNHVTSPLLLQTSTAAPAQATGKEKGKGVSRSGTVKSSASTKSKERTRAVSLTSSPTPPLPSTISAPRQLSGTTRSNTTTASSATDTTIKASGAKPLKLTPATPDANGWLTAANVAANTPSSPTTGGGASVKRQVSNASSAASGASGAASTTSKGAKGKRSAHTRGASFEVANAKSPNLMTLVEGISADRQRAEIIGSSSASGVISGAGGKGELKMMLPSEYMKVTASSSGGAGAGLPRSTSPPPMPMLAVQPPTPGVGTDKGKKRQSEPAYLYAGTGNGSSKLGDEEAKHTPPPRSASPLRSAMRHGTGGTGTASVSSSSNGTVSAQPTPPPPPPVMAPIPRAPPLIVPLTLSPDERPESSRRDSASSYATARTESDDGEGDGNDTEEPATPTKPVSANARAMEEHVQLAALGFPTPPSSRIVPVEIVETPRPAARTGPSPPSTDVSNASTGTANGATPTRRKSVRLNVPPTPTSPSTTSIPQHGHARSSSGASNKPLPLPSLGSVPSAPSLRHAHNDPDPAPVMPAIPSAPSLKHAITQPKPQPSSSRPSHPSHPSAEPEQERTLGPPSSWDSAIADDGYVRDMWADTSEEDEDYKQARKSMNKAIKHEKAAYAEAAVMLGPKGKKRQSVKSR